MYYLGVYEEALEAVDEVGAVEGVAADAHNGGLAQALLRRLEDCLIRERARPRHDADLARLVDVPLHTPFSVNLRDQL